MTPTSLPHDHGQPLEPTLAAMPSTESFQMIAELLKQLKSSGLIVSRRSGKEVYYRAADTQQAQLLHRMIETLLQINCPDPTIGR